jgi:hypothetical protein
MTVWMATEEIPLEGLQLAVGVLSSKWSVAVLCELAGEDLFAALAPLAGWGLQHRA